MTENPEPAAESPDDPTALTSLHVRRAADGNPESLGWVVTRLSPLLLAQAAYRLGPRLRALYDPEDLVNDAWIVALPRLGELPARDGRYTPVLLRFLSTTLLHRINNLARRHIRNGDLERPRPEEDRRDLTAAEDPLEQIAAEESGVITQAVKHELQGVVTECLTELEERDREMIILRGVEQQPNRTVAGLLGLKPPAVAMRYRRALDRLRARLPRSVFDEMPEE
jgi:RNA polymerase sigma factor (sigma-70 family)